MWRLLPACGWWPEGSRQLLLQGIGKLGLRSRLIPWSSYEKAERRTEQVLLLLLLQDVWVM